MNKSFGQIVEPDKNTLTYEKYLKISELLDLQKTLAVPAEHDEMLFIIIHQAYELWFKQLIHEANQCCASLDQGHLMRVLHVLKRMSTIQKVLVHQIDILETMPPDDFSRFRNLLNPASGFQSCQFRTVEFMLGAKDPRYLRFFEHDPALKAKLEAAIAAPTLYDHFFKMLASRGYDVPREALERDVTQGYKRFPGVVNLYHEIYTNPYEHGDVYFLLETLLDVDENFLVWRQRHVNMVERVIGSKMGTGGSSGADYLRSTLSKRFFPEIWEVRNLITGPKQ
jgi:tryptophan 2,3-dioxygenase